MQPLSLPKAFLNTYVSQEWINAHVETFVPLSSPWLGSIPEALARLESGLGLVLGLQLAWLHPRGPNPNPHSNPAWVHPRSEPGWRLFHRNPTPNHFDCTHKRDYHIAKTVMPTRTLGAQRNLRLPRLSPKSAATISVMINCWVTGRAPWPGLWVGLLGLGYG